MKAYDQDDDYDEEGNGSEAKANEKKRFTLE